MDKAKKEAWKRNEKGVAGDIVRSKERERGKSMTEEKCIFFAYVHFFL